MSWSTVASRSRDWWMSACTTCSRHSCPLPEYGCRGRKPFFGRVVSERGDAGMPSMLSDIGGTLVSYSGSGRIWSM
jgi:hypothetical protein